MVFLNSSTVSIRMKTMSPESRKKRETWSHSLMAVFSMVNGIRAQINDTAEAIKYGQMVQYMMDIGKLTKRMVVVDSFMLTATFMMVIGRMTKLTVLVSINISKGHNMKATGKMTNSMVKAKRNGQMVLAMKAHINMAKKKVLAILIGQTALVTKGTL